MAELKTKKTKQSVDEFINGITDEQKRKDCFTILKVMEKVAKEKGKMWGPSIIGFCDVVLKYDSGRELDWFKIGFSPRKENFTFYIGIQSRDPLLKKLGKYKIKGSCLHINKVADIDQGVLKELVESALKKK